MTVRSSSADPGSAENDRNDGSDIRRSRPMGEADNLETSFGCMCFDVTGCAVVMASLSLVFPAALGRVEEEALGTWHRCTSNGNPVRQAVGRPQGEPRRSLLSSRLLKGSGQ